ncbi:MAG: hypothetical protein ACP5IL_11690 [Syntrophobacteraceae bacterium]
MKTGIILYVVQGKEDVPLKTGGELAKTAKFFGVAKVFVAGSEDEASYGWMSLLTRGIEQVLFMSVGYNAAKDSFESLGAPIRLCG